MNIEVLSILVMVIFFVLLLFFVLSFDGENNFIHKRRKLIRYVFASFSALFVVLIVVMYSGENTYEKRRVEIRFNEFENNFYFLNKGEYEKVCPCCEKTLFKYKIEDKDSSYIYIPNRRQFLGGLLYYQDTYKVRPTEDFLLEAKVEEKSN